MLGSRLGSKTAFVGSSLGSAGDDEGVGGIPGVSRDGGSNIYVPANATEWSTFLSAVSLGSFTPTSHQGCQDAAGNLLDSIGTNPLVPAGAPVYQQAVSGWSRMAAGFNGTVGLTFALGAGPLPPTASVTWLLYVLTPNTPGGNRQILTLSNNGTGTMVSHTGANKLVVATGVNTATSAGNYTLATVYPVLVVYNLTATTYTMYTNQEIVSCLFGAVLDGNKGLGAVLANSDAGIRHLMCTEWTGAAAEFTTANARTLLSGLGWSIPW